MGKCVFVCAFLTTLLACKNEKPDQSSIAIDDDDPVAISDEKALFTQLDSTHTGIAFANIITEIEGLNILLYEYLYNGGGVAAGDINNDGLTDLYFNGSMEFSKLYLNQGNFRFRDITDSAGVDGGIGFTTGVTMVDINGDGLLDIYACKSMSNDPQYRNCVFPLICL